MENKYLEKLAALTIDMSPGYGGQFNRITGISGNMPVPAGASKVTPMPNPKAGTSLMKPMKIGVSKPAMGLGGKLLRGAGILGAGALATHALFGGNKKQDTSVQ